ncbi:related to c2h2 zinc finger protein flbc [Phaffia rhodozyma]|uniref:Related to c2h2 zinc finger protein flbc n=1 Tax=Phaffia rhodozyma TaxID=264483 RepID=A0A0F7SY01_PHARH|nr:related to c2h2 zinc finger protein flbc [Phaffia rhodozyma]
MEDPTTEQDSSRRFSLPSIHSLLEKVTATDTPTTTTPTNTEKHPSAKSEVEKNLKPGTAGTVSSSSTAIDSTYVFEQTEEERSSRVDSSSSMASTNPGGPSTPPPPPLSTSSIGSDQRDFEKLRGSQVGGGMQDWTVGSSPESAEGKPKDAHHHHQPAIQPAPFRFLEYQNQPPYHPESVDPYSKEAPLGSDMSNKSSIKPLNTSVDASQPRPAAPTSSGTISAQPVDPYYPPPSAAEESTSLDSISSRPVEREPGSIYAPSVTTHSSTTASIPIGSPHSSSGLYSSSGLNFNTNGPSSVHSQPSTTVPPPGPHPEGHAGQHVWARPDVRTNEQGSSAPSNRRESTIGGNDGFMITPDDTRRQSTGSNGRSSSRAAGSSGRLAETVARRSSGEAGPGPSRERNGSSDSTGSISGHSHPHAYRPYHVPHGDQRSQPPPSVPSTASSSVEGLAGSASGSRPASGPESPHGMQQPYPYPSGGHGSQQRIPHSQQVADSSQTWFFRTTDGPPQYPTQPDPHSHSHSQYPAPSQVSPQVPSQPHRQGSGVDPSGMPYQASQPPYQAQYYPSNSNGYPGLPQSHHYSPSQKYAHQQHPYQQQQPQSTISAYPRHHSYPSDSANVAPTPLYGINHPFRAYPPGSNAIFPSNYAPVPAYPPPAPGTTPGPNLTGTDPAPVYGRPLSGKHYQRGPGPTHMPNVDPPSQVESQLQMWGNDDPRPVFGHPPPSMSYPPHPSSAGPVMPPAAAAAGLFSRNGYDTRLFIGGWSGPMHMNPNGHGPSGIDMLGRHSLDDRKIQRRNTDDGLVMSTSSMMINGGIGGGVRERSSLSNSITSSSRNESWIGEKRTSQSSSSSSSGIAKEAKYECPHCQKRFNRPSSLRIHIYSHTGEKPFVCDVPRCGRQFSVQSNLKRHKKTHESRSSFSISSTSTTDPSITSRFGQPTSTGNRPTATGTGTGTSSGEESNFARRHDLDQDGEDDLELDDMEEDEDEEDRVRELERDRPIVEFNGNMNRAS